MTPLPSNAAKLVKEERKLQMSIVTEELQTARDGAILEIMKAYELVHNYFIGEAQTQWDKIMLEMHSKDPWISLNGESHSGLCRQTFFFYGLHGAPQAHNLCCRCAETQRYYMQ